MNYTIIACRKILIATTGLLLILTISCSKDEKMDEAAGKMQEFVISVAEYTRQFDPDFIIIPQNGVELAYNMTDPANGFNTSYMDAVDGFATEELFYFDELAVDEERLDMLRELREYGVVMVSDYLGRDEYIPDAINRNLSEGFLCFPRRASDYYYTEIPDTIINSNNQDVNSLSDARNYLYLISTEEFTSKQEMLGQLSATDFDILLIDLFYEDMMLTSSEIQQLKTKSNGGKRLVISYINIGAAEEYRYYWQKGWKLHNPSWIKKNYEGYEGEYWVEFWNPEWQDIISGNNDSYMKKILDAGFDGAYLDNVEAYYFLYSDE